LQGLKSACKRGQTVNLLDTQSGLVVTLEFHEISNRGRKLPAEATEFCAFLKTYLAQRVNH
jgi:hypothetical protein